MGCVVNGPGEAADADIGVACGAGSGVVFSHGKIVRKVPRPMRFTWQRPQVGQLMSSGARRRRSSEPSSVQQARTSTTVAAGLARAPQDRGYRARGNGRRRCPGDSHLPWEKTTPEPAPQATPISASAASPGPFTTQPMTATFTGLLTVARRSSTSRRHRQRSPAAAGRHAAQDRLGRVHVLAAGLARAPQDRGYRVSCTDS